MHTHFEEISTRLFSPRLWAGFGAPWGMNPLGSTYQTPSGNAAFGFFDDFHSFHATSLEGPYLTLVTAGGTLEQTEDTATVKGILKGTAAGDTQEDEIVIQWGRGKGAPFKFADKDLAFEVCFSVDAITAAKWNIGVGLGEVGMGTTDYFFTDSDLLADKNFCGFVKLVAEAGVFDGAYKADSQTYQDGATKTKLNALKTFTASLTTYGKLGLRYRAHPKLLEWYVDGAVPGGHITPARLTATELDAATFPDDVFVTPIFAFKDSAGNAAMNFQIDWWACAQYE